MCEMPIWTKAILMRVKEYQQVEAGWENVCDPEPKKTEIEKQTIERS
jgi:hypothetical protein